MKVLTKDNIEITCTPEEFVTLMKAGVFGDTIADRAAIPQNPYDPCRPESYKGWLGKHPIVTAYGVDSIQVTPVYGCQAFDKPFPDSNDIVYTGKTTENLQQFFGKPSGNTAELRDTEPEHQGKDKDDKDTES